MFNYSWQPTSGLSLVRIKLNKLVQEWIKPHNIVAFANSKCNPRLLLKCRFVLNILYSNETSTKVETKQLEPKQTAMISKSCSNNQLHEAELISNLKLYQTYL